MQKILVANQNIEQNKQFCQYLANDKKLEVIGTTDGTTTLNKYLEIKPNVLVLDSYFDDMNCNEIIDRLSMYIKKKMNCNTILTIDKNKNKNIFLSNTAKIYRVFNKKFDPKDLFDTIKEICNYQKFETLTEYDIDLLLLRLKIALNSNGADYIREAIIQCYYYPYLLKTLDDVFSLISKRHNKTNSSIRSSFRSALEPLNTFKEKIDCPIMKYFNFKDTITPKNFLEISTLYLHIQKNKK